MAVNYYSPVKGYQEGAIGAQTIAYNKNRNALAQQELANAPGEMARRNALLDLQVQGAQQNVTQGAANFGREGQERELKQALAEAQHVAQNPAALSQMPPAMQQRAREQLMDRVNDPQAVSQWAGSMVAGIAARLGQGPAPQPKPYNITTQEGPNGSSIVTDGGRFEVVQPRQPQQPQDERLVQVAGEGGNPMWVRESDAVNKPAYVARDKPAAQDVKWQREIKSKQPRLLAAERRVQRLADAVLGAKEVKDPTGKVIKERVKGIAENAVFDGGPLDAYALAWTKQGQEVTQAKAALTSELTALTRVPGIGSQSDLETRLASLPFPSSEFSPEVNRRAIAELQSFMADLKDVYGSAAAEIQSSEVDALLNKYAPR